MFGNTVAYFINVPALFIYLFISPTDSLTKTKKQKGDMETDTRRERGLQRSDEPSRCWTKRWNTEWKATGAWRMRNQRQPLWYCGQRDCERLQQKTRWVVKHIKSCPDENSMKTNKLYKHFFFSLVNFSKVISQLHAINQHVAVLFFLFSRVIWMHTVL